MGYAQESGYTPIGVEAIMADIMAKLNVQFNLDPPYTTESFVGTNAYKYFYALAQRVQEGEIKTSEIFQKLQGYIELTNQRISRPVVTQPGTIERIESEGYQTSVKPMILADAGKRHICIDVDDGTHAEGLITITSYANLVSGTDDVITIGATAFTAQTGAATPGTGTFQAATSNDATAASLAAQINAHAVAGALVIATADGPEVTIKAIHGGVAGNSIALGYTDNDTNVGATKSGTTLAGGVDADPDEEGNTYEDIREFLCTIISQCTAGGVVTVGTETETIVLTNGQAFDFSYNLPTRYEVLLRLTITLSENNQILIGNPDDVKIKLLQNIAERYRLGKNFEPQRYFAVSDAPWSSQVLLEYSIDGGGSYSSSIYDADYNELFMVDLANIELVEV